MYVLGRQIHIRHKAYIFVALFSLHNTCRANANGANTWLEKEQLNPVAVQLLTVESVPVESVTVKSVTSERGERDQQDNFFGNDDFFDISMSTETSATKFPKTTETPVKINSDSNAEEIEVPELADFKPSYEVIMNVSHLKPENNQNNFYLSKSFMSSVNLMAYSAVVNYPTTYKILQNSIKDGTFDLQPFKQFKTTPNEFFYNSWCFNGTSCSKWKLRVPALLKADYRAINYRSASSPEASYNNKLHVVK